MPIFLRQWLLFRFLFSNAFLYNAPEGGGATPPAAPPAASPPGPDLLALQKENQRLKSENGKLKKGNQGGGGNPPPGDLNARVKQNRERNQNQQSESRELESAITFNLNVDNFVKDNADLLPSEVSEIVAEANKETYDTAKNRSDAVKAAMIQSFFSVSDNVELLTSNQKKNLEDYLKMTKNGREGKASSLYENLLEPALETLRRVKKAEEISRAKQGFGTGSKVDDDYRQRLIDKSRKKHLNLKGE